jgi:hypothetical protein
VLGPQFRALLLNLGGLLGDLLVRERAAAHLAQEIALFPLP